MFLFTYFFTKHSTKQWSTVGRSLGRFNISFFFLSHGSLILLFGSILNKWRIQGHWSSLFSGGGVWFSLSLTVFNFAVYQFKGRLQSQMRWKQRVGGLCSSLGLVTELYNLCPLVWLLEPTLQQGLFLNDLQLLLDVTATLVGQGCYTLYFCLQSLLLIFFQMFSFKVLALTECYYWEKAVCLILQGWLCCIDEGSSWFPLAWLCISWDCLLTSFDCNY